MVPAPRADGVPTRCQRLAHAPDFLPEPLPAFPGGRFLQFREVMTEERIYNVTAVSLQTREHNFGVILFPQVKG